MFLFVIEVFVVVGSNPIGSNFVPNASSYLNGIPLKARVWDPGTVFTNDLIIKQHFFEVMGLNSIGSNFGPNPSSYLNGIRLKARV